MKFNRIGDHLIDLQNMFLVNTEKGITWHFNFNEMVARKITTQSKAAHPIRYDENSDRMMIWKQRRWQAIENGQEAILFMFNHRIESTLLE